MKLSWRLLLLCVAAARAQADEQQQQQQLTFGVTDGARLSNPDGSKRIPDDSVKPLVFTSSSTKAGSSSADLYHLSVSLLNSLTSHAPPPPPTAFTSVHHSSSSTPLLDELEAKLGWPGRSAVRAARTAVKLVSGGSKARRKGRDLSVTGVLGTLKTVLLGVSPLGTVTKQTRTISKGPGGWRQKLEAMNGLRGSSATLEEDEVEQAMQEVLRLAREAAERGSAEAWVLLGDLHLTGHLTLKANTTAALEAYTKASEGWGSPEAQYKLGFLYGSNFGGAVDGIEGVGKQGSALLHYTFAALSGHVPASMTVGYRHWVGIGTKQSCKDALGWYKAAADEAMRTFNAGPPGGRLLPPPKLRLSDLQGGAYGPGASSTFRPQVTGGSTSQTQQEWDDLLEFHHFHAERGDVSYMFRLGRLYYQGFGGNGLGGGRGARSRLNVALPGLQDRLSEGGRDFNRASKWFMAVALKVWKKDAPKEATAPGGVVKRMRSEAPKLFYDGAKDVKVTKDERTIMFAGLAAGYLGKMYLRGEGANPNYAKAFLWFQRGVSQGDRESNNGLGIMYRDGLGVERDVKKANLYFHGAAQADLAEAQVNLGKFHFGMGDFALATTYFEHAIRYEGTRQPDTFQSYYYLAELNARALNRDDQCPFTVSFYKMVAEKGDWETEVWWEAERALQRGDERSALLGYWIMAERGYEQAQNNVAFILDRDKQRYRLPIIDTDVSSNETDRLALAHWTRSAAQDNVDALVKMGDYYYAGLGGWSSDSGPQLAKAAACYQSAATTRISAMAMWNLGWMHEHGQGVAKDYHMAKRYYDQALEASADAYFPVTLSLISLYARALYHVVFKSPDDELKALSLFGNFLGGAKEENSAAPSAWSFGRAWREIQRRWGVDLPPEEVDAMPVVDNRERGQEQGHEQWEAGELAEQQRQLEANGDPMEWGTRGLGGRVGEDEDDDFFLDGEGDLGGTVAIVGLCVILGWLLYFRQGRIPQEQPHAAGGAGEGGEVPRRPAEDEPEPQRLV